MPLSLASFASQVRVASLAFFKSVRLFFKNLEKPEEIWLFLGVWRYFKNQKKPDEICLFSGFFSEQ